MEFVQAVRTRRMCRDFDPDTPVARATVTHVLDLALRAPSAGFSQGTSFVVLDTPADRQRFWEMTVPLSGRSSDGPDAWLRGVSAAPVLVLVVADPQRYADRYSSPDKSHTDSGTMHRPVPFWDVDAGMASMVALLAAQDAGAAALFFGIPGAAHPVVRELLALPDHVRLVGVMAFGYPCSGESTDRGTAPARRSRARPAREPFENRVRFGIEGPTAPRGAVVHGEH